MSALAGQMLDPSPLDSAVELGAPAVAAVLLAWPWLRGRRTRRSGSRRVSP